MVKDEATIKAEIKTHIMNNGNDFSNWYSGIATDPEDRLFNQHKVKEAYIYRNTGSEATARRIEDYLINTLKTQGGGGGGDKNTTYVYSYKIKSYTVEST